MVKSKLGAHFRTNMSMYSKKGKEEEGEGEGRSEKGEGRGRKERGRGKRSSRFVSSVQENFSM